MSSKIMLLWSQRTFHVDFIWIELKEHYIKIESNTHSDISILLYKIILSCLWILWNCNAFNKKNHLSNVHTAYNSVDNIFCQMELFIWICIKNLRLNTSKKRIECKINTLLIILVDKWINVCFYDSHVVSSVIHFSYFFRLFHSLCTVSYFVLCSVETASSICAE